jgi:hypothetical protein
MIKESVYKKLQFDANTPNWFDFKVQESLVQDQISLLQLGKATKTQLYDLKDTGNKPSDWSTYPSYYKFTSINLLLDYNLISVTRQTYSLLTFFGDLGGLYEALTRICGLLLSGY